MKDCVLCLDIGTTSLKAGLITADGEVVSFYSHKFLNPHSKYIANKWYSCLLKIVCQMKNNLLKNNQNVYVKALSISGNGPTIVCDNGFTISWNKKNKIEPERTGKSLFLGKIIQLKQSYEKQYIKTKYIFSGPEFLIYKLTGNAVTILPEKRFESAYWSKEILNKEKIDDTKLPPFYSIGQEYGKIKKELLSIFCFSDEKNIPVFGAGPDFVAALIGTNTLENGKICDRAGSSEGINYCVSTFISDKNFRTLPSLISGLWNISILIPESSKISNKQRIDELKKAFELLKEVSVLHKIEFPKRIVSTGGQTKNEKWMIYKSKQLKLNFSVCECSDSELLGDSAVAWFSLGKYNSLQEASKQMFKEDIVYENL